MRGLGGRSAWRCRAANELFRLDLLDLAAQPIPDDLEPAARSAWVQNKRVQIDAIKWVASRQFRQAWGDRVDVSVTDGRVSLLAALEAANNRVLTIDQDDVD